ncbi:hypothetical protein F5B20DRAFT_99316 [Whalleya microplaca]|nr:hypothetical protein F5B20DRAFT_99316 [Whalleya microplaca]
MASPIYDHHTISAPTVASQASRSPDSRHPPRILVEPTPENQNVYNQIRREHQYYQQQTDVANQRNLLALPQAAPPMSRSTTNESYGSENTIHSHLDHSGVPSPQDTATNGAGQPRRPRGRRKGPLAAKTRLNTAVKRKLKLTCLTHKAKKTTCDCYDFSRLEEGYLNSESQRFASPNNSSGQNDVMPPNPIERPTNGDIGTFGIGGAAATSLHRDVADGNDLLQTPGSARASTLQFLDAYESASVHDIMQVSMGQTYYPGSDATAPSQRGQMQVGFLEIGSQMPYSNRWHCEYKGPTTSISETSSETCSWTGPIQELASHFENSHHPFQAASPPLWWVCSICKAKNHSREHPPSSIAIDCSASSWQRWYYGSTTSGSVTESVPPLTQYSESDTGRSWDLHREYNQPGPAGGGSNNSYNAYYEANFHDRWSYSDAKWEEASSVCSTRAKQKDPRDSRSCLLQHLACMHKIGQGPTDSGTNKICDYQPKLSTRRSQILWSYGKILLCHLPALKPPPLITTAIQEEVYRLLIGLDILLSCTMRWPIGPTIGVFLLGFLATWIFNWYRSWTVDEVRKPPNLQYSTSRDYGIS